MADGRRCAQVAREHHDQLAGTARPSRAFVLVQQEGAWAHKAVAESKLPNDVKRHLAVDDVETLLIRNGQRQGGPACVYLAQPEVGRLQTRLLADPRELLDLDLSALLAGTDVGWEPAATLLAVCTNSKRDRCCAEIGRPIVAALAERWPDRTWEVSHLGGHRFAGVMATFPSGWFLGNLDPDSAVAAIAAMDVGRLPLEQLRGRAGLPAEAQYAEIELRKELGDDAIGGITVVSHVDGATTLRARDAEYVVRSARVDGTPGLMSCRDDHLKPTTWFTTLGIERI